MKMPETPGNPPTVTPTTVAPSPSPEFERPPRKGPPPPAVMDGYADLLRKAKDEEADPEERMRKVHKLLSGMALSSHETRWLRDAMLRLIEAITPFPEETPEPAKDPK